MASGRWDFQNCLQINLRVTLPWSLYRYCTLIGISNPDAMLETRTTWEPIAGGKKKKVSLMRLEIQNFLRHQCLFLSIFSVCYLYSVFYICPQVFILLSISFLYSLSLGKYFIRKEENLDLNCFWKRTRYLSGACFGILLGGKHLCRSVSMVLQGPNFLYRRSLFISSP